MDSVKNSIKNMVIDEEEALNFYKSLHWSCGVYCPVCGSFKVSNRGGRGRTKRYSCKECGTFFNDFTGTFLEGSKIPFGQVLWILTNIHNKSVKQMSEELGLNRKTVMRYHKIIRDLLEKNHADPCFDGKFEFDETYVNAGSKGIKKNIPLEEPPRKRALKRRGRGTYDGDKPPLFTVVHRETGYTIFLVLENLRKKVSGIVDRFVKNEAVIFTDEYVIYNNLIEHTKVAGHYTINHGRQRICKRRKFM